MQPHRPLPRPQPPTAELPLVRRFPALAAVPRAHLGAFPTPLDRVEVGGRELLLKRDDLSGSAIGGNKVRGLEFLLAGVRPGDHLLTVGPRGSTHALATAICGAQLGATTSVVRWNQVMNDAARAVDARLRRAAHVHDTGFVPLAYALAFVLRAAGAGRTHWIPAGGASPLAALGHVNAALEFADQILAGNVQHPDAIMVPLGTGGTAAGLALGLRIAGLRSRLRPVRVVPRIVGRAGRVVSLANACATLIERLTGERLPRLGPTDVVVEHGSYGGAYGRPVRVRADAESALEARGVRLDDTYSRKAMAAALASPGRCLLWLTFDGRLLQDSGP